MKWGEVVENIEQRPAVQKISIWEDMTRARGAEKQIKYVQNLELETALFFTSKKKKIPHYFKQSHSKETHISEEFWISGENFSCILGELIRELSGNLKKENSNVAYLRLQKCSYQEASRTKSNNLWEENGTIQEFYTQPRGHA